MPPSAAKKSFPEKITGNRYIAMKLDATAKAFVRQRGSNNDVAYGMMKVSGRVISVV